MPEIIVATHNASRHIHRGMELLLAGASPLDAVETVVRGVEADESEHSVGLGGYPNLIGEVELDASIMEGSARACGAVGAVRKYAHPISIARGVMERMDHVFLVADGAETFAAEMGMESQELLTPEARDEWAARIQANVPPESFADLLSRRSLLSHALLAKDPERIHGTVNVLAMDREGNIASGVSTSGWSWKYPGRLGDSPVIGAGNYCDNRFGAAACTGHGELTIRGATARSVIQALSSGMPLLEACAAALEDTPRAADPGKSVIVILAMDAAGHHCSVTNSPRGWGYCYMTPDSDGPIEGEVAVTGQR